MPDAGFAGGGRKERPLPDDTILLPRGEPLLSLAGTRREAAVRRRNFSQVLERCRAPSSSSGAFDGKPQSFSSSFADEAGNTGVARGSSAKTGSGRAEPRLVRSQKSASANAMKPWPILPPILMSTSLK
jgi:hypothetical protein